MIAATMRARRMPAGTASQTTCRVKSWISRFQMRKPGGLQLKRWDTSERLVHRSEYIVRVVRRAVYGDRNNPAFGEMSSPAPRTPVCLGLDGDRCHYDASVVVHAIVEKLVYHVPFYRQSTKFATLGLQNRPIGSLWILGKGRRRALTTLQASLRHGDGGRRDTRGRDQG